jgi:ribosomal protein S13
MARHVFSFLPARVFLVLPLFLLINLSAVLADRESKVAEGEILVIGSGMIFDGNVAQAKETAISDALKKGVEEYLARRLGRQGMINNFPALIRDLIPGAREVVENFLILAEDQTEKHCTVLMRLKVNDKMMEGKFREMGLILREGPPIKVLFLISHHDPGRESNLPLTIPELSLHRVFEERGFSPINRMFSFSGAGVTEEMKILDLSEEDVLRWGAMFSADVVIHGRWEILDENLVSISLSALDVRRGLTVLQEMETDSLDDEIQTEEKTQEVTERIITKVVSRVSPAIVRAMEVMESSTKRLEITLKGLKSFKEFTAFRNFLEKDVRGVKAVQQTRVQGNAMSVLVEFSGEEDAFLDMVTRHEKLPFPLEVGGKQEGEIIFNIR